MDFHAPSESPGAGDAVDVEAADQPQRSQPHVRAEGCSIELRYVFKSYDDRRYRLAVVDDGRQRSMARWHTYEAAYVPERADYEQQVEVGLDWLEDGDEPGAAIVVHTVGDSRTDTRFRGYAHLMVSRLSGRTRTPTPRRVLVCWPDERLLDFAETLAVKGAMCVLKGSSDLSGWISAHKPVDLLTGTVTTALLGLSPEVRDALESIDFFGGKNNYTGPHEREHAIRRLRELQDRGEVLDPDAIYQWARNSGSSTAKGAARLRRLVDAAVSGRRVRGSGGRFV